MGNLSDLSNDLLVKILLFIPSKDAVATSLLSKRWRSVWKLVPKLEYTGSSSATATRFINKYLQLSNAQFLETFHLRLKRGYEPEEYAPEDYETWVNVAVARYVRVLELFHDRSIISPVPLPMSLYTHETLVVLRLKQALIEHVPSTTCFRCLKTLSLLHVSFSTDKTVDRFLSCFPVLESLVVRRWGDDNVKTYAICVPSLQSLEIKYEVGGYHDPRDDHGFVINAPSLKNLEIVDHFSGFCSLVDIPEQVEAKIHLRHCDSEKLLGSLTSARSLSLCLKPQMDLYTKGDFNQLVTLELCVKCSLDWLNLILRHSPRLRVLRFKISRDASCRNSINVRTKWEQPSCVPECLLLSLETVDWIWYKGTQEEKYVVMYLLENGNFLKMMNIEFSVTLKEEERNLMQMELDSKPRSSSNCQLSFVAPQRKYRRPRRPLPKSTEEPPLNLPKSIRESLNLPNSIGESLNLSKSIEEEPKVCINRIRINDLPDDLLVKIILLIPLENAVATCLLSKRWENLWKLLPKFEFSDSSRKRASTIINNILVHNNAPFLETLHLKLSRNYAPEDYQKWAEAAVARNVRDLEILHYRADLNPIPFPRILYTCQTLVALRLQQTIIVDVPSTVCLRSLKDLSLLRVSFSSGEIVSRFLSACPNLETLILIHIEVILIHIEVNSRPKYREVVINAPSLKTLKIDDKCYLVFSVLNMPELVTAEIKLRNGCDSKFLGCLTSAKHLSLCFEPKLDGCLTSDFNQLVSLELCIICGLDWFGVILKHTPKLRVLKLRQKTGRSNKHCVSYMSIRHRWDKPSCVPECLISSLETVEWDGYKETGVEREVAIYILENAKRLETVAIIPPKSTTFDEKLKMIMELKSTSRCSSNFLL